MPTGWSHIDDEAWGESALTQTWTQGAGSACPECYLLASGECRLPAQEERMSEAKTSTSHLVQLSTGLEIPGKLSQGLTFVPIASF